MAKFYIPPVILAGSLKIKTKGSLEFELVDWESSISITEKLDIGELEHQFYYLNEKIDTFIHVIINYDYNSI